MKKCILVLIIIFFVISYICCGKSATVDIEEEDTQIIKAIVDSALEESEKDYLISRILNSKKTKHYITEYKTIKNIELSPKEIKKLETYLKESNLKESETKKILDRINTLKEKN